MYRDGPGANFRTNPISYTIEKRIVTSADVLALHLAPGGGTAIRFRTLE
nr:glycoside hydrolase family 97 C-terminal domain-containing protein [Sphingomonas sp.]